MLDLKDPIYGDKLTIKSLKSFLKNNNLTYSVGNKIDKIETINNALERGAIDRDTFRQWTLVDLFYEGNKHVYVFPHKGFEEDIINIEELDFDNKWVHHFSQEQDKYILMLGETKFKAKYDNDTGARIDSGKITYMVILEIYNDILVMYIDPPTYLYNNQQPVRLEEVTDNVLTARGVIDEYRDIIQNKLGIELNEAAVAEYVDVLNYLCKSVNDTISRELTPYTNKIVDSTIAYMQHCIKELGIIESEEDDCIKEEEERWKQKLLDNFISYWEYYILEKSDVEFEFANEYGKIIKEEFKTRNGSTVRVATKDKNIYEEQLHYNIKGTVLDSQRYGCKELKFSWNNPQSKNACIVTNLLVSSDNFKIMFTSDYDKEEIKYVLSTISEIKDRVCNS